MAAMTDEDMSRALWRKSTFSGNGNDCVEVAAWRKTSYSGNGGECVEAGVAESGWVLVRDTTNREGGTLSFPASAWRAFAAGLKQH
jgi:Domain of unknown function (DUF397)